MTAQAEHDIDQDIIAAERLRAALAAVIAAADERLFVFGSPSVAFDLRDIRELANDMMPPDSNTLAANLCAAAADKAAEYAENARADAAEYRAELYREYA